MNFCMNQWGKRSKREGEKDRNGQSKVAKYLEPVNPEMD